VKGDWTHAWQPMVDAVGRDFGEGRTEVWGETIEASMVRRYIEPLELDSKLHSDAAFARAHGYADIVVPSTAIASFAMPLLWNPGDSPLFDDAARDAQPTRSHIGGVRFGLEPPTTHFFGVDAEADYLLPVVVIAAVVQTERDAGGTGRLHLLANRGDQPAPRAGRAAAHDVLPLQRAARRACHPGLDPGSWARERTRCRVESGMTGTP
jgi:hypothetical protein